MDVAAKLQIRPDTRVAILHAPDGDEIALPEGCTPAAPAEADAVVVFATTSAELETRMGPALEAAKADRLAWIAYPKAGKLGTDLSRDRLRDLVLARGAAAVRQVAIDEVWSALRFRPGRRG